ncbi:MnhB domain-containing protein [Cysteiniphilum halobium]|uniref:MnhB domain-containing protein n=1 Tax=Cysteiniphilum halobium TaxID=2219059 RepID=UPI003F837D7B
MSILLKTTTRFLTQIMLLLSVLLVLRGHNYPGGGFIGALCASLAITLYALAHEVSISGLKHWTTKLITLGLCCLLLSICLPLFFGKPMLTGLWLTWSVFGSEIKLGSPLIFDFGIYFTITGSLSWLIINLEDKKI